MVLELQEQHRKELKDTEELLSCPPAGLQEQLPEADEAYDTVETEAPTELSLDQQFLKTVLDHARHFVSMAGKPAWQLSALESVTACLDLLAHTSGQSPGERQVLCIFPSLTNPISFFICLCLSVYLCLCLLTSLYSRRACFHWSTKCGLPSTYSSSPTTSSSSTRSEAVRYSSTKAMNGVATLLRRSFGEIVYGVKGKGKAISSFLNIKVVKKQIGRGW